MQWVLGQNSEQVSYLYHVLHERTSLSMIVSCNLILTEQILYWPVCEPSLTSLLVD